MDEIRFVKFPEMNFFWDKIVKIMYRNPNLYNKGIAMAYIDKNGVPLFEKIGEDISDEEFLSVVGKTEKVSASENLSKFKRGELNAIRVGNEAACILLKGKLPADYQFCGAVTFLWLLAKKEAEAPFLNPCTVFHNILKHVDDVKKGIMDDNSWVDKIAVALLVQ